MLILSTMKDFIKSICITASEAIKEMNISRNAFYSDKVLPEYELFKEAHKDDWIFTPEKFQDAIKKSGLSQYKVSLETGLHYVTINIFLKGKRRPTRSTGDYQAIKDFCEKWS